MSRIGTMIAEFFTFDFRESRLARIRPKKKHYIVAGIVSFVLLFIWYGFQPLRGSVYVGICRTFAEMRLSYPQTFKIISLDDFDQALRIYYSYTGAFGEYRSNMIECKFGVDPRTGQKALASVMINRMPVDPKEVIIFNKTIPVVEKSGLNLIVPGAPKDSLYALKRD